MDSFYISIFNSILQGSFFFLRLCLCGDCENGILWLWHTLTPYNDTNNINIVTIIFTSPLSAAGSRQLQRTHHILQFMEMLESWRTIGMHGTICSSIRRHHQLLVETAGKANMCSGPRSAAFWAYAFASSRVWQPTISGTNWLPSYAKFSHPSPWVEAGWIHVWPYCVLIVAVILCISTLGTAT